VKINIFGKQAEVRTEFAVIAIAVLVLLGCLAGYAIFRDNSDIIIEDGGISPDTVSGKTTGANGADTANKASVAGVEGTAGVAGTANAEGIDGAISTAGTTGPTGTAEASGDVAAGISRTTGSAILDPIRVYVVGCVNRPGIVTLEKGQVIADAVEKAGGLTGDAEAGSINMVYTLTENTMLYIKSKKELEAEQEAAGNAGSAVAKAAAGAGKAAAKTAADNLGQGAELLSGSGGGTAIASGANGGAGAEGSGSTGGLNGSGENSRININTADIAELDKLPGVGEATARDIIAYREKNGPFRKAEDVMKVPRIKQARFDSIKDMIAVN
jgi:competence protein ComEA